jgi:hypothetical protein
MLLRFDWERRRDRELRMQDQSGVKAKVPTVKTGQNPEKTLPSWNKSMSRPSMRGFPRDNPLSARRRDAYIPRNPDMESPLRAIAMASWPKDESHD